MRDSPPLLLQAPDGRWLAYERPSEILEAWSADEVTAMISKLEEAADSGLTAVGFLTYEAAPAFDPALATHPPGSLPLGWFGLFREARSLEPGQLVQADWRVGEWRPSLAPGPYGTAIADIHRSIARGDTYQVNFTQRLRADFHGSPLAFFHHLAESSDSRHGAYIDTGDHAICSFSPELFFSLRNGKLTTRPMKGTAPRGRTHDEDAALRTRLRESVKNRAENVMIVDMMRNDLGRVARPGTVSVESLWEIERYRTLFQMTSTCSAETDAPVGKILGALFPSASITGAPKVRTMEIIRDLETSPRGIYTGAIGRIGPGRRADFNVAIRTVHIDRQESRAEYGIGGGIVWDSVAEEEYSECLTKALVVTAPPPRFSLLETLRWEPGPGFTLLERHLDRLEESAAYFDRPCDRSKVETALEEAVATAVSPQRVRLILDPRGRPKVETSEIERKERTWRVEFSADPVDPGDPMLFHKTTSRGLYDRARRQQPAADDVLLWNLSGEITESTVANVVVRQGDRLLTPPIECGLLAGTLRAQLLAEGRIEEAVLYRADLESADEIFLINSVRGWIPAHLYTATETLVAEPA